MENFRRQFLLDSVQTLQHLSEKLQNADQFSAADKRDAFRTLHTIKGTAQTFGLAAASRLAHELENLLSAHDSGQVLLDDDLKNLFLEGIGFLIESLREKNFQMPPKFSEKVRAAAPFAAQIKSAADDLPSEIPNEFSARLSGREKTSVEKELNGGKNIYGLEISFESANFANDFKDFRESLNESGEVIATFPSQKFSEGGKIGFWILYASSENISAKIKDSGADIIFQTSRNDFSEDADGVLAQVVKHGKAVAAKLDKQIQFEISNDKADFSPQNLKLVFECLLHLVRNAVDHAIEKPEGKIEIQLKNEKDFFRLIVTDDGRGIDAEEIRAKAVEKKLISDGEVLSELETINLIFLPEFSTKTAATETSGRGIGLDAVKTAIEKAGGKISVETRKGKGTTFEILLPKPL